MKQDALRNCSICIFEHDDELHFGSAIVFCCVQGVEIAVIDVFKQTDEGLLDSL